MARVSKKIKVTDEAKTSVTVNSDGDFHLEVVKAAVKAALFVITVKIENSVYEGRGATALEALQNVPTPSNDLISSGSVSISHGDNRKDDIFFPTMQLRRLLNPYNMEVLINDLALGL